MFKKNVLFILGIAMLLSGCSNKNINIYYMEDPIHQISNDYTYKFIGESKHFYFQTGKVYYNGDYKELLITNFKMKDKFDENTKYNINLYFNDKLLYGETSDNATLSKNEFENIIIAEYGKTEKNENGTIIGESDSFLETSENSFKDDIKLEVKYCKKSKCKKEVFDIDYIIE